jgi:uncharacterized protein YjbK
MEHSGHTKTKSVIIATISTPETPTERLIKTFDNVETAALGGLVSTLKTVRRENENERGALYMAASLYLNTKLQHQGVV